jgi:hypothetical protein
MIRIAKTAAIAAATCALVLGGAGASSACEGHDGGHRGGHHQGHESDGKNGKKGHHKGGSEKGNGKGGKGGEGGHKTDHRGGNGKGGHGQNGHGKDGNGRNGHGKDGNGRNGHGKDGNGGGYGARAEAVAFGSPGVLSGNVLQAPVNAQFNVCGNSVNLLGVLNPASGNVCVNK